MMFLVACMALILSLVTLIVIGLTLKEFKPSSPSAASPGIVQVTKEKGTIRKVFSQECKDCYQIQDPKKLRFKDVFKLKYVSFLLILYFLIFLGFNIFYATFPRNNFNDIDMRLMRSKIVYVIKKLRCNCIFTNTLLTYKLSKKLHSTRGFYMKDNGYSLT